MFTAIKKNVTEEPLLNQTPYTCPICLDVMVDPVITKQGYTFERSAILHWLRSNLTCPLTRDPLTERDLTPNKALKNIIENYRKLGKLPQLVDPVPSHVQRRIWTPFHNSSSTAFATRREIDVQQLLINAVRSLTTTNSSRQQVVPVDHPLETEYIVTVPADSVPVDLPENPDFSFLRECEYELVTPLRRPPAR